MLPTRFTEPVGCTAPIQVAGMGAAATPDLTAAVSNAGALGMLGTGHPGLGVETQSHEIVQELLRDAARFIRRRQS